MAVALALVAWMAAGCSESDEGGSSNSCVFDSDCARGEICEDSACGEQQCFAAIDCQGSNRTCLESGLCSSVECFTDDDCVTASLGTACIESACFSSGGGDGCTTTDDCPAGQVCTLAGTCGSPPDLCASDGDCPTGTTCDVATGACMPAGMTSNTTAPTSNNTSNNTSNTTTPTGAPPCTPCNVDDDCGGADDACSNLGDGLWCTENCTTNDDCAPGFECARTTEVGSLQCLPVANRCEGCLLPDQACEAPQICDLGSLSCRTPENCAPCGDDSSCGPDGRCTSEEGVGTVCALPCDANSNCPTGYVCSNVRGADVCVTTDSCGMGNGNCQDPPVCGGDLPFLNEEFCQCVECGSTPDCNTLSECVSAGGCVCSEVGRCLVASQTCESGADCAAPTPFCQGGFCVQCFGNQDCPNQGELCIRGSCRACECPPGQRCDANGQCVDSGSCTVDTDCTAIDALGMSVQGKCHTDGTCYTPGSCGSSDAFGSVCPNGLTCEPALGGLFFICAGCSPLGGECRADETCIPNLLDQNIDNNCASFNLP